MIYVVKKDAKKNKAKVQLENLLYITDITMLIVYGEL